jgi:hypothetical protein
LRPEKSWRPIISVVVDQHQHYEVNLGCDGQNPNLKERFMMFVVFYYYSFFPLTDTFDQARCRWPFSSGYQCVLPATKQEKTQEAVSYGKGFLVASGSS